MNLATPETTPTESTLPTDFEDFEALLAEYEATAYAELLEAFLGLFEVISGGLLTEIMDFRFLQYL